MRLPLLLLLAYSFSLLSCAGAFAYAAAQTPLGPGNSTVDRVVVGNSSGTPMGGSPPGYDVVVRDANNAPMPGRSC